LHKNSCDAKKQALFAGKYRIYRDVQPLSPHISNTTAGKKRPGIRRQLLIVLNSILLLAPAQYFYFTTKMFQLTLFFYLYLD